MSEEVYSYLKSLAKMYLERESPQLYPRDVVVGMRSQFMGYMLALLDFDIVTMECYYEWCDYLEGVGDCPPAS